MDVLAACRRKGMHVASTREIHGRDTWPGGQGKSIGTEVPPTGYNGAPMRLLLQQKPLAGEAPKYVQLILQQDLLGGWTLLRESGQVGGRSTLRRDQFLDQPSALKALEAARDAQLKRGFQLMFARGSDAPA